MDLMLQASAESDVVRLYKPFVRKIYDKNMKRFLSVLIHREVQRIKKNHGSDRIMVLSHGSDYFSEQQKRKKWWD